LDIVAFDPPKSGVAVPRLVVYELFTAAKQNGIDELAETWQKWPRPRLIIIGGVIIPIMVN
jgi:hypothetical protein